MSVLPEGALLAEMRRELLARIGDRVRRLRTERGWTQAQLAGRVREVLEPLEPDRVADVFWTRPAAISRLENGALAVPLELIEILARALEVDPLLLIEPAYSRAPRNAEQIELRRREEFAAKVDELYKSVEQRYAEKGVTDAGIKGYQALGAVLALLPESEADTVARMLERLARGRIAELEQETAEEGIRLDQRRLIDHILHIALDEAENIRQA